MARESRIRPLFAMLAEECRQDPAKAIGTMVAVCDDPDPSNFLKWQVSVGDPAYLQIPVEQNPRLGGSGKSPCPGDLLAMSLAACMDGAVRMVADRRGVELDAIRVEVTNRADLREILGVPDVPLQSEVGISMSVQVVPADGESRERAERVLAGPQRSPRRS